MVTCPCRCFIFTSSLLKLLRFSVPRFRHRNLPILQLDLVAGQLSPTYLEIDQNIYKIVHCFLMYDSKPLRFRCIVNYEHLAFRQARRRRKIRWFHSGGLSWLAIDLASALLRGHIFVYRLEIVKVLNTNLVLIRLVRFIIFTRTLLVLLAWLLDAAQIVFLFLLWLLFNNISLSFRA